MEGKKYLLKRVCLSNLEMTNSLELLKMEEALPSLKG